MTKREILNKIRSLELELEVMLQDEKELREQLGKKAFQAEVDKRLMQYKYYLELLKSKTDEES